MKRLVAAGLAVSLWTTTAAAMTLQQVCAAAKQNATGKKAAAKLKCHAKAAKAGRAVDEACLKSAEDKFESKFRKAESLGSCATVGDAAAVEEVVDDFVAAVAAALPGGTNGRSRACASSKLKAAGKKAASKVKCYSRATRRGEAVDPDCLGEAEYRYALAFQDAESMGGCATSGDAGAIEVQVDAFVGAVVAAIPLPGLTPTPTPSGNLPPDVSAPAVYRTYPGMPIALPLQASDPEGGPLQFTCNAPPDGASLDASSGVFAWTPREDQIGGYTLGVSVSDDGVPPRSTSTSLPIKVSQLDACTQATCDPATGCVSTLEAVTTACCQSGPAARVPEPVAACPGAAVLFVGRNVNAGFGRLYDCDRLRMSVSGQTGAIIRYNVQARCLDISRQLTIRTRIDAASRKVADYVATVGLAEAANGFQQQTLLSVPVLGGGPFFDLENAEANVTVTLTDRNNTSVTGQVRVVLTSLALPDLPETP